MGRTAQEFTAVSPSKSDLSPFLLFCVETVQVYFIRGLRCFTPLDKTKVELWGWKYAIKCWSQKWQIICLFKGTHFICYFTLVAEANRKCLLMFFKKMTQTVCYELQLYSESPCTPSVRGVYCSDGTIMQRLCSHNRRLLFPIVQKPKAVVHLYFNFLYFSMVAN